MSTEPEPIQGKCWMVRETQESGKVKDNIVQNRRFKYDLVYGEWEPVKNKDGLITGHKIVGESVHQLTGEIGRKSLEGMADRFNAEGKKPDKKAPKTRLDGYKQTHDNSGGNSLFDCVTLQRCISYKPEQKTP